MADTATVRATVAASQARHHRHMSGRPVEESAAHERTESAAVERVEDSGKK